MKLPARWFARTHLWGKLSSALPRMDLAEPDLPHPRFQFGPADKHCIRIQFRPGRPVLKAP